MLEGVIIKGIGGFYYVKSEENIYECRARGRFRKDLLSPLAGDKVLIEVKGDKGSIEEIRPRKNVLIRPPVANIDCLLVVVSAAKPAPNTALIDNFLILGEKSGIETVILISKADLAECDSLAEIYRNAGYRVIISSTVSGEGKEEVLDLFKGKITALAGNSGVGKSSLLNMVCEGLNLKTSHISEKLNRGRHTTRHTELLELGEDSFVLDTPGFSSFELPDIEATDLENYYIEFEEYIPYCKFKGCAHVNEPECGVKKALEEGIISSERYKNYVAMYEELKKIKKWDK